MVWSRLRWSQWGNDAAFNVRGMKRERGRDVSKEEHVCPVATIGLSRTHDNKQDGEEKA